MNALKSMAPYWIIMVAGFYVLPLAIVNMLMAMLVLLTGLPAICFVSALVYGKRKGFNIAFSIVVALLFIPTVFIFYNSTAWVYGVAYFAISLIGNIVGKAI